MENSIVIVIKKDATVVYQLIFEIDGSFDNYDRTLW